MGSVGASGPGSGTEVVIAGRPRRLLDRRPASSSNAALTAATGGGEHAGAHAGRGVARERPGGGRGRGSGCEADEAGEVGAGRRRPERAVGHEGQGEGLVRGHEQPEGSADEGQAQGDLGCRPPAVQRCEQEQRGGEQRSPGGGDRAGRPPVGGPPGDRAHHGRRGRVREHGRADHPGARARLSRRKNGMRNCTARTAR
jgi:hypothetical protein